MFSCGIIALENTPITLEDLCILSLSPLMFIMNSYAYNNEAQRTAILDQRYGSFSSVFSSGQLQISRGKMLETLKWEDVG